MLIGSDTKEIELDNIAKSLKVLEEYSDLLYAKRPNKSRPIGVQKEENDTQTTESIEEEALEILNQDTEEGKK